MAGRAKSRVAMVLLGVPVSLLGRQDRTSLHVECLGQYEATRHDFWLGVSFSEYQDDSSGVPVGLTAIALMVPLPEHHVKCSLLLKLVHF